MQITNLDKWMIAGTPGLPPEDKDALLKAASAPAREWISFQGVAQVHDVLIQKGIVSDRVLEDGESAYLRDTAACDWIYRTEFTADRPESRYVLRCAGLDTVCDLFLNGTHIGTSESMYLPFRADVTGLVRFTGSNELLLYFHGHRKMLDHFEKTMPEEFRGIVPPSAMLLKSNDYGASFEKNHGYSPIGVFDAVTLLETDDVEWEAPEIDVRMNENFISFDKAAVRVRVKSRVYGDGALSAQITVTGPDGAAVGEASTNVLREKGDGVLQGELLLKDPKLWWPKNYGDQPLYLAKVRLYWNGREIASPEKPFGVRVIRKTGNMRFTCNGVPIRLWGANIAPIYGPSNVFNRGVAFDLIEKLDRAGINATRIWGPSKPYPDCFYDEFDRRGILVWQDLPTGNSPLPWGDHYTALLEEEARHMVTRLKHHPSIYLWCGGNEHIYMNEFLEDPRDEGFAILRHGFARVCGETDPSRYYHVSCPSEGAYMNDPDFGDSHGSRAYRRYLPGEPYGVFYSENIRCYPPQYKSMKRWLGDRIWEEGYVDQKPFGCIKPMPASWAERLGNNGEEKLGPIEDYYAAQTPQELIYKFTAAAGQDLYGMFARARRGKPAYRSGEESVCRGFTIWKSNDPWPNFYCALVDYYGECALTYYAVKRAVKPVWIDLEVADRIHLWGVNDTSRDFNGTVELTAYRMDQKKITRSRSFPVTLLRGSSRVITDLDFFGPMHWFTVLQARLLDQDGNTVLTTCAYLRKENMLPFPNAGVELAASGDELIVRADDFARCVELSGGEDGMEFGWFFEDNFFDLMPNEEKRVRIFRRGESGVIRAKAQYGDKVAVVRLADK